MRSHDNYQIMTISSQDQNLYKTLISMESIGFIDIYGNRGILDLNIGSESTGDPIDRDEYEIPFNQLGNIFELLFNTDYSNIKRLRGMFCQLDEVD